MDLQERHGDGIGVEHRHPWELSRTQKTIEVFSKYLDIYSSSNTGSRKYINIGAGDLFFDNQLLQKYKNDSAYAVDIGYDSSVPDYERITKFHYLEEVSDKMDYSIMMDSLEYMPDDTSYINALSEKVKSGGYLFFTLPAVLSLFSEHDRSVGNLRRYDIGSFQKLISSIPGIEIIDYHHFYTTLFLLRWLQLKLHMPIDKKKKITSYWNYSERHVITRFFVWCLNLDFTVNRFLSRHGIRPLGLSLLVVCRKN